MKSIYKKGAALAAAALMTVAFAGCGGGDKSASKGPKDTLTVVLPTLQTAWNRPTIILAGRLCATASVNALSILIPK